MTVADERGPAPAVLGRLLRAARWRPLLGLIVPALFLLFWHFAATLLVPSNVLLPPPGRVFRALADLAVSGVLWGHVEASLVRVASGYVLAVLVGVPVGIAMGASQAIDALLGSSVNGLRPIPVAAWVPLSIILMGIGEQPAIFLVFVGTVWAIILNTSHGVRNVPKHLIWAALTMGATRLQIFRRVVFPAALPSIFAGMRIAVGIAFTCVIVAELIAVRSGIGYMITEARLIVRADLVIAGMVVIALVGFLLDAGVRWAMRRALRWQKGLISDT